MIKRFKSSSKDPLIDAKHMYQDIIFEYFPIFDRSNKTYEEIVSLIKEYEQEILSGNVETDHLFGDMAY